MQKPISIRSFKTIIPRHLLGISNNEESNNLANSGKICQDNSFTRVSSIIPEYSYNSLESEATKKPIIYKKNIIFLFCGESRCNPLSHNNNKQYNILDSYNNLIFTELFKTKYNYKIFITTDDIHLENTFNFFGKDKIVNIHLLNTGFYHKPIKNNIRNIDYYLNIYNQNDFSYYWKYENSIRQYYKVLDCYNLFKNEKNIKYDYIVRIRLDIVFTENILNILNNFNDLNIELLTDWDFFSIGKSLIMDYYCRTLENKYGKYNFSAILENINFPNICKDYLNLKNNENARWRYAAEIQLFDALFEYCNINNYNINEKLKPISCCFIQR